MDHLSSALVWLAANPGVLSATIALFAMIVACFPAYAAVRGLNTWHRQNVGKRRMEVAEQVLIAAHQAAEAIRAIRSPMVFTSETDDRAAAGPETNRERADRDLMHAYEKRFASAAETLSSLARVGVLARIYFGDREAKLLTRIHVKAVRLKISLIRYYARDRSRLEAVTLREFEAIIWDQSEADAPDAFSQEVQECVDELDKKLRHTLDPVRPSS